MKYFNAYTDGSFGDDRLTHGGVVFADELGEVTSAVHVKTGKTDFVSMRNVGGEILASWTAILIAVNSVKKYNEESMDTYQLNLVYDYEGVGKWLNGSWRAKKKATMWYVKTVRELLQSVPNLEINLQWVRGHSTTRLNNIADAVADYQNQGKPYNAQLINLDEVLETDYGFK